MKNFKEKFKFLLALEETSSGVFVVSKNTMNIDMIDDT